MYDNNVYRGLQTVRLFPKIILVSGFPHDFILIHKFKYRYLIYLKYSIVRKVPALSRIFVCQTTQIM